MSIRRIDAAGPGGPGRPAADDRPPLRRRRRRARRSPTSSCPATSTRRRSPPIRSSAASRENFKSKLDRIHKAAKDDAVKALYLEIDGLGIGWGKLDELTPGHRRVPQDRQEGLRLHGGRRRQGLPAGDLPATRFACRNPAG